MYHKDTKKSKSKTRTDSDKNIAIFKFLLALVLLLSSTYSVHAASLEGHVYNSKLEEIHGAVIEIANRQTVTQNGYFRINVPSGTHTISAATFNEEGISTHSSVKEITIGNDTTIDIILLPSFIVEEKLFEQTALLEEHLEETKDFIPNMTLAAILWLVGAAVIAAISSTGILLYKRKKKKQQNIEEQKTKEVEEKKQTPDSSAKEDEEKERDSRTIVVPELVTAEHPTEIITDHNVTYTNLEETRENKEDKKENTSDTNKVESETLIEKKQERKSSKIVIKPEELERVLAFIKSRDGKTTQKELRKSFTESEAKVSLLLKELEAQGKIKRIKEGRIKTIILQ